MTTDYLLVEFDRQMADRNDREEKIRAEFVRMETVSPPTQGVVTEIVERGLCPHVPAWATGRCVNCIASGEHW